MDLKELEMEMEMKELLARDVSEGAADPRRRPLRAEDGDRIVQSGTRDGRRDHVALGSGSTRSCLADRQGFDAMTVKAFVRFPWREKRPIVHGLLHKRDLVTLAGRRREGKTTFLIQMGIATADAKAKTFLGYEVAGPSRGLLMLLEDDPGELKEKIARQTGDRDLGERLRLVTREDFRVLGTPVDIRNPGFRDLVSSLVERHRPSWIGLDNISQVVRGNYNSPTVIDGLMRFAYDLAAKYNCAVVFAAHPRKRTARVRLAEDPDAFFEQVMGSSHGINSTGSLWGLEREGDTTVFVGGRQRADGQRQVAHLQVGDDGNFAVVPNDTINLQLLLSTDGRRKAWEALPDTFSYAEAERRIVPAAMRSTSSFHAFFSHGQRLGLIVDGPEGKWQKLKLTDTTEPGELTEVTEVANELQQP
jgi:hypothetical protein